MKNQTGRSTKKKIATGIRTLTLVLVFLSVLVTYQVLMVDKDYLILTNPEGPDTTDYFEE